MEKLALLLTLLIPALLSSQSCLPDGITFSSQAEIDSFQVNYPNCKEIEGYVIMRGFIDNYPTDITNLYGLSNITSIKGNLEISMSHYLTDLSGLEGLTTIGGSLGIEDNINLQSLQGLDNLTTVGGSISLGEYLKWISISDLTGLNKLKTIGGDLQISYCRELKSFEGLDSLETIGGQLNVVWDTALINFNGLERLQSIGSLWVGGNIALTSMEGLDGLNFIKGDINIHYNDALVSLAGLDNIESDSIKNLNIYSNNSLANCDAESICDYLQNPTGKLHIYNNSTGFNNPSEAAKQCGFDMGCLPHGDYILNSQSEIDSFPSNYPDCTQLEGDVIVGYPNGGYPTDISDLGMLDAINYIGGDLKISGNDYLTNLSGLNNLVSIGGGLQISSNLTSLAGLENLVSVGDMLVITNQSLAYNLNGLNKLTTIGSDFYIVNNLVLMSLSGLDKLNTIGGDVQINNNFMLKSLSGLENVTSVQGNIEIYYNDSLNDLTGLHKITYINGDLIIGSNNSLSSLSGIDNIEVASIDNIYITNNSILSTCDVKSICDYLTSLNGKVEINNNALGCANQQQVEEACGTFIEQTLFEGKLLINPNPFTSLTTIEYELNHPETVTITFYNQFGKEVDRIEQKQPAGKQQVVWTPELPGGIYYFRLQAGEQTASGKVVLMR